MKSKIVIDNKILFGKPIIKGTRISVEFILGLLSSGLSYDEIIKEYPNLRKEDIFASIAYALETIKNEEIITFDEIKKSRITA